MVKLIITLSVICNPFFQAFSQEKCDSIIHKNSIKFDVVPLYHVFFDNRIQIRAGIEYERYRTKKSSIACYMDFGLYDKYGFIKYYDFFNQNQGMYFIQQKILIKGFHLLPSYNYYFDTFKKRPKSGFFVGAIADVGFYWKKVDYINSSTLENYSDKYNQAKLGIGLSLGFKKYYGKHFFGELKTSALIKLYNYITEQGRNPVKSLDAQWTSPSYNFWWISNIKIGYAF
jgi:hypothetical protein